MSDNLNFFGAIYNNVAGIKVKDINGIEHTFVEGDLVYNITNNLSDVSNSNLSTKIVSGQPYYASLTVSVPKYVLDRENLSILMGGVDITSTAYDSLKDTITISSVTGNVVIMANAILSNIVYMEVGGVAYATGVESTATASARTDYIPCTIGATVTLAIDADVNGTECSFISRYYDSNYNYLGYTAANKMSPATYGGAGNPWMKGDGTQYVETSSSNSASKAYVRFVLRNTDNEAVTSVSGTITVSGTTYQISFISNN